MRAALLATMFGCQAGGLSRPPTSPDGTPGSPPSTPPPPISLTDATIPERPLDVVVNEVWPDRSDGPDLVELFNPTAADVSLQGWSIGNAVDVTESLDPSLVVPAGGFLLLVADGDPGAGPEHVGLQLSDAGESVMLRSPGHGVDVVTWGLVFEDYAVARTEDGCQGDCLEHVWAGTPGTSNGTVLDAWSATDIDPDAGWELVGFDDAGWGTTGRYRRLAFDGDGGSARLDLGFDTGVVVWLDGVEVARSGLPMGTIDPSTPALERVDRVDIVRLAPSVGPHVLALRTHADASGAGSLEATLHLSTPSPPSPAPPITSELVVGDQPDPSDPLLDRLRVHRVDLVISAADLLLLDTATHLLVPADVVIDGLFVGRVGVSRRGKYGSLRPMSGKPKLKVDFNAFEPGRQMFGLDELMLNSAVQDCPQVREALGYTVFRRSGGEAPREAYTRLAINGVDYGQYWLLESIDDEFLRRNFADGTGNLYDGSYANTVYEPLLLVDFAASTTMLYDLEAGVDVGHADLYGVQAALDAWEAGTADYASVGAVLDWDAVHRHMAAEVWVGHADGYVLMPNNYWVYVDPTTGKVRLLPWDTDQVFVHDWQWFTSTWAAPWGRIAARCWVDPACAADQAAIMGELLDTLAADPLTHDLDVLEALSWDGFVTDPRRECDEATALASRTTVRDWIALRDGEMRAFWGL